MKVVDSKAMSLIDSRATSEYGMPSSILMENAGIKAYAACRERFDEFGNPGEVITFIAGSGNNGGDAFVMARQAFLDGLNVAILLSGPPKSKSSAANLEIARKLHIRTVSIPDEPTEAQALLRKSSISVDGLYGTGISGSLRTDGADLVKLVNNEAKKVVSIDLPSGLGDEFENGFPLIRADTTLCLGLPKKSLYLPYARGHCGDIVHIPIGFPPQLLTDPSIPGELLEYADAKRISKAIPLDAHKGNRGKVAVFAGSVGTTGAPVLASESAARSRTGLVFLFVDPEAYVPVASKVVSVMARRWNLNENPGEFELNAYDAYLAGPGWGFDGRLPWLTRLIESGMHGVLDADALTLLSRIQDPPDLAGKVVLTPHPGEMARLLDTTVEQVLRDPVRAAGQGASKYNATVVLKGHVTTISEPGGRYWIYDGCNPALGTGGSGDVLSGIIAGNLSAGYSVGESALLGVLIHAMAAEAAFAEHGWFLAEDLLPFISKVFKNNDA